ncbi:Arylsulfatase [Planctomycetes bacterium Pan216]|uniref:Arylsulfatase n=1 Tax=Kolteria novifilia TaxID=2527975 RepID=A0A518BBS0_9BACT|nr:Arylsulfatase [Planctomycetes bacterium Pan216]
MPTCLLTALCSLLGFGALQAAETNKPPNIVVILVDDLGYGDLACQGAKDLQTPHVDGLIANGMKLNHFYANSPVCSPTRAALLTGCYPSVAGVPGVIRTHPENSWGYLRPDLPLLSTMLKRNGYHTAIVGKWHLGLEAPNIPTKRGFDLFQGYLGDMMDDYTTHLRHDINYMRLNETEIDPKGHATDIFSTWAVNYINDRAKKQEPFFLYLAYNAPHTPIQPPDSWLKLVKKKQPGISDKRAKLVALIEHLDKGIGEVLHAIKSAGIDERTVVVFTSDNGGQCDVGANNGKLHGCKGEMYEGGLRVPASVTWPGHIKPGVSHDGVFLTMDLFPTLCEVAGVPVKHRIDGQSFAGVLKGDLKPFPQRDLYWERREGGKFDGLTIQAVRRGNWKLLHNSPFEPMKLFNLNNDPREQFDLMKTRPKEVQALSSLLRKHIQRGGAVPWQKPTPPLTSP